MFCDHTSGYKGKYETHFSLFFTQDNYRSPLLNADILIHIGEISADLARLSIGGVWRVNEDGEVRNTFGSLTRIFEMPEEYFFVLILLSSMNLRPVIIMLVKKN